MWMTFTAQAGRRLKMVGTVSAQSNDKWFDVSNHNQPIAKDVADKLQKAGIREGSDGSFYDKDGKKIMGPDGKTPATAQEVSKYLDEGTLDKHLGPQVMDSSPPPSPLDQHSFSPTPVSN
jgi:hypothetical protein